MKPGTPCIIEPKFDEATPPAVVAHYQQVAGLIVTTKMEVAHGYWDVLPTPVVIFSTWWRDAEGNTHPPGGSEIFILENWLRPLGRSKEALRVERGEVAHA